MDRRDFLKSTGGVAAAAAGVATGAGLQAERAIAAPAVSSGLRTLTLATPWANSTAGYADEALRLARRIETVCDGALRVDLVTSSGPEAETDMCLALVHRHTAHHPAFSFFAGLPGETALAASELDGWLIAGGGQELWDEIAASLGIKPLLAGHAGAEPVLWSRRPVASLDDLSQLRLFTRGLNADVARGLGAVPVALDETSVELAVATGDLDAVEWGSLVHASALAIPAYLPFGLKGAFGAAGSVLALDIKLGVWERLSGTERSALAAAASAEFRATLAEDCAARQMIEGAVRTRFGAAIERPTPELCAATERVAATIVAHAAGYDARAAQINASYLLYRRSISGQFRSEAMAHS